MIVCVTFVYTEGGLQGDDMISIYGRAMSFVLLFLLFLHSRRPIMSWYSQMNQLSFFNVIDHSVPSHPLQGLSKQLSSLQKRTYLFVGPIASLTG